MKKNPTLRLCILTSGYPRFKGDLFGNFISVLARELVKTNLDVFVLTPHSPGYKKFEQVDEINIHRFPYFIPHKFQKLCYGSGIAPNLRSSLLAKFQLPLFIISQLLFLCLLIKRKSINIVNSHWMIPQGLNCAIIKKFFNVRHILTVHAAGLFALKRFPLGRHIARFIVANSDHIFTVSSFIKSNLDELVGYKTRATVLPMGVDTNLFIPKNKFKLREQYKINSNFILLLIGRLVEKKGIEYLIDAMRHIVSRLNNIKLIIIGSGIMENKLKSMTNKLGLSSNISFLGFKKNEHLIDYYNMSDLVVLPSIFNKYGETEGMPVVILEALACGTPLIASNISGIPDLIQDWNNGLLTIPKNPQDIADKIVTALTQCNLDDMSNSARKTALLYDCKKIALKYTVIIKNILANCNNVYSR